MTSLKTLLPLLASLLVTAGFHAPAAAWASANRFGGHASGGWGGADRGLVGGAIYATGLLLAHYVTGAHAKASLGSFPPLLIVVDAVIGIALGAIGGRLARAMREREAVVLKTTNEGR